MQLGFPITSDFLAVISFWIKNLRAQLLSECALTIPQFRVLSCLEQQKILCLHELADMLELSPNAATYIVAKLEEGDLVRKINGTNRRMVRIETLPQGSELVQKGYEVSEKVHQEITKPLGSFLQKTAKQDLQLYEGNYLFQAKSDRYLSDGTSLNTLMLYENKLNEVLKKYTLNNLEFRVLFELEQHPFDGSANNLSRILLTKMSGITVACNKLQVKGYVIKENGKVDRRSVYADMTALGYELISRVAPEIDNVFMGASKGRSSEGRQMELKASSIIARDQRKKFVC